LGVPGPGGAWPANAGVQSNHVISFYGKAIPAGDRMKAYILVKVLTGHERSVVEALQSIPALKEIHFLFGEYDYLLTLDIQDTNALALLVSRRIRKVAGIERTSTLIEAPI
jgi:DNA-binding Lrp family transcriptional regulator